MAVNQTTNTGRPSQAMWGLGLSAEDAQTISVYAGQDCSLSNYGPMDIPTAAGASAPLLVWVSQGAWTSMPAVRRNSLAQWDNVLRVLVQDEHSRPVKDEDLVSQGFMTSLRAPLDEQAVLDVLRRARELSGLYADIIAMTKEVLLERELMSRKTAQLEFLNRILTRASESLDAKIILNRAREDMSMVAPLRALQAAFWSGEDLQNVDLFLSPDMAPADQTAWVEYKLEQVVQLSGRPVSGFDLTLLESENGLLQADLGVPDPKDAYALPLEVGGELFGVVVLVRQPGVRLGKDQTQTMTAAFTHLALALKNSMLYREAQFKAEFDGLTRIHNRQGFDRRLGEELSRHRRYGHPLSLMMLDLDHFKSVNDTYGHEAGDLVLREVGALLADSLRNTDYPARYGGEEFAVVLPHTSAESALTLAERLREKIAETIFHFKGLNFQITVSIGISSLIEGGQNDDLLGLADRSLYLAKHEGRNTVRMAMDPLSMDDIRGRLA